jgi:hypothetical protein
VRPFLYWLFVLAATSLPPADCSLCFDAKKVKVERVKLLASLVRPYALDDFIEPLRG